VKPPALIYKNLGYCMQLRIYIVAETLLFNRPKYVAKYLFSQSQNSTLYIFISQQKYSKRQITMRCKLHHRDCKQILKALAFGTVQIKEPKGQHQQTDINYSFFIIYVLI
jgi:hypothetical protein